MRANQCFQLAGHAVKILGQVAEFIASPPHACAHSGVELAGRHRTKRLAQMTNRFGHIPGQAGAERQAGQDAGQHMHPGQRQAGAAAKFVAALKAWRATVPIAWPAIVAPAEITVGQGRHKGQQADARAKFVARHKQHIGVLGRQGDAAHAGIVALARRQLSGGGNGLGLDFAAQQLAVLFVHGKNRRFAARPVNQDTAQRGFVAMHQHGFSHVQQQGGARPSRQRLMLVLGNMPPHHQPGAHASQQQGQPEGQQDFPEQAAAQQAGAWPQGGRHLHSRINW